MCAVAVVFAWFGTPGPALVPSERAKVQFDQGAFVSQVPYFTQQLTLAMQQVPTLHEYEASTSFL